MEKGLRRALQAEVSLFIVIVFNFAETVLSTGLIMF